ncbi:MAG: LOG family protein [Planctomycetes bacterium]|nr:LOG family protein [Planctomycetota bacterium]
MSTSHPPQASERSSKQDGRSQAIKSFLETHAPGSDHDLLGEMMVTICRLARDGCGRGELKILNTAMKELRYGFKIFEPYSEVPKVSIFGSSRTAEDHPQYLQAVKFADLMRQAGWMSITGAGDGIMRAGHHGATRESSFGVAIRLPFEQSTNTIIANDEKLVNFKYFFTRKVMFMKEARAIALFPGGFGTQDEGFEALTLVQTGKAQPVPIVMIDEPDGTYWQHWRTYVQSELLRTNMISPADMNLLFVTDDADAAVREILHFYRRYHSSRFVRQNLVVRMQTQVSDKLLERLNDDFGDLLEAGRIRQVHEPLPEEYGECPDLPRLVMQYHRANAGRLRQLINTLNDAD